jgi:hypothetical protein
MLYFNIFEAGQPHGFATTSLGDHKGCPYNMGYTNPAPSVVTQSLRPLRITPPLCGLTLSTVNPLCG